MTVLPFAAPTSDHCGFCGKVMRRSLLTNQPAYCSFDCGVAGQPEAVLRMQQMEGKA